MATLPFFQPSLTGQLLNGTWWNVDEDDANCGKVWNGSGWEAFANANYATYVIPQPETPSGSGDFPATRPAGIPAGKPVQVIVSRQAGGSAARTDPVVGEGSLGNPTVGGYATGQDPATLVWQALTASSVFTTSGSVGLNVVASFAPIPGLGICTAASGTSITPASTDPEYASTSMVGNRVRIESTAAAGSIGTITSSPGSAAWGISGGWSGATPSTGAAYVTLPPAASGGGSAQTGDVFGLLNPMISSEVFTGASLANVPRAGYSLASAGLDAVKGFGSWSFRQTGQVIAAILFGKRSGVPAAGMPGTATIMDDGSTAYGTITFDTNGNITGANLTPPA